MRAKQGERYASRQIPGIVRVVIDVDDEFVYYELFNKGHHDGQGKLTHKDFETLSDLMTETEPASGRLAKSLKKEETRDVPQTF